MMHHVVTTNPGQGPFTPLSKLQLPPHQNPKLSQKLDWATECQTPLNANEDKNNPNTTTPNASVNANANANVNVNVNASDDLTQSKDSTSPSPRSDDGPDQPSTPPATRQAGVAPQKSAFSPSPVLASEPLARLSWRFSGDDGRGLADELLKMQIRDKKPDIDDSSAHDASAADFTHRPLPPVAHSRGSSGDTSSSDSSPAAQLHINTAVGSALASKPYTAVPGSRPRSFQEGLNLTEAERKRLQLLTPVKLQGIEPAQGPKTSPPREPRDPQGPRFQSPETPAGVHQPRYPSLQDQPQPAPTYPSIHHHHQGHRPPPINLVPGDMRGPRPDEEYMPQRMPSSGQFAPPPQGRILPDAPQFRPPRAAQYPIPAPIIPPPSAGYAPYGSPHLPLGPPTPQMYDLNLPGSPFRAAHQHSASDPAGAGMRDAQLLMAGMHHSFVPPSVMPYPNQFFPGAVQDAYQHMPQPAPFPQAQNTARPYSNGTPGSAGSQNGTGGGLPGGPSANNRKLGLYKTELCRSWEEKGSCRYGPKCQFAHGEDEIRKVARHPKYKTEICRTFWVSGSCPYGKRCCFIHTELPAPGVSPAAGSGGSPPADAPATNGPAAAVAGRARSQSTNSDPTDAPVSLLTRIAAQRSADAQANANANAGAPSNVNASSSTPTEGGVTPTYQFPQQRPGALRVDTTALDSLSMKQNKSAYPYTHTHSLPKGGDHTQLISPGPVTAGPDLGRSSARFDVVGFNDQRYNKQQTPSTAQQTPTNTQPGTSSALRHSFNGTETLNLQTQLALSSGHSSPFGAADANSGNGTGGAGSKPAPAPAHGRSESASSANWGGGFTRGLGVPANASASSPWSGDLSVGANRLGNNNSGNNWS